ncbi:iron-siderophore ABC transporter substrate-binding protein [Paractinoplanes brasiliensis]|uniref:Iron complex transport system substrate-binding protein n=1 Tax=Paractinoplanes brasiliensis TaxID=52695 RepID=A0A4R6JTW5_9ACTN|nr:iron-siderophore ABC transporter substrate-binding protein [Actinoplanes brasiliensis]TDO38911.1 iron complex transport system substrate-binding protein [Actinoplanes brasiliensis]GID26311.1 ABC transporter substrate-binding protein [Actinoplanes brasiliensis]
MRLPFSRAGRLLPVALLSAVVALTGCSTTGTEDDNAAPATGSSAASAFPVTITTAFGDVTVSKQPERVVALGWSDADVALSLGVQPVGASDWLAFGGDGQGPWNAGKYTTPPAILGTLELDMEKVAALKPDLILDTRSSGDKARHDSLAKLGVPVVDVPKGGEMYLTTWEQQLDMIGKALGKQSEAAALKSELDAKFTAAAAANPGFKDKTVAAVARTGEGWGAYVSGDGRVDFLTKLGFKNAPAIEALKKDSFYITLSNEQLDLADADVTVVFLIQATLDQVKGDKLFQAVPSVKAGHVAYMDNQDISNAFSSSSVAGLSYAVDKVTPLLAAAAG